MLTFAQWAQMTPDEQKELVRRTYDIHSIENVIQRTQFVIGLWSTVDSNEYPMFYEQLQILRQYVTLDDLELLLELFGARYNNLIMAGEN